MFDEFDPDYVAEITFSERYAEEEEGGWEEPWAVYDPE